MIDERLLAKFPKKHQCLFAELQTDSVWGYRFKLIEGYSFKCCPQNNVLFFRSKVQDIKGLLRNELIKV